MISSKAPSLKNVIQLRGVRQNNLKGFDCEIRLGEFTVITGVSGSGKSSLAFDTLYAEGQRRYLETFSAYTRQFLERIARPDVKSVEGIPPAVAIDPYGAIKTSRSTVGTMTGLNDYMKLLYARASQAYCPSCSREVAPEGTASVLALLNDTVSARFPALIVAPVSLGGFDDVDVVRTSIVGQGYARYLRATEVRRLDDLEPQDLDGSFLNVVVDRLASARVSQARRADSIEQAFRLGGGSMHLCDGDGVVLHTFTEGLHCGDCDVALVRPAPGLFSFNNPYGACARCRGFGKVIELDWNRIVPQPSLSLEDGAIRPWKTGRGRSALRRAIASLRQLGVPTNVPFSSYDSATRDLILEGGSGFPGVRGFFDQLESKKYKMHVRVFIARYRGYETCPDCLGDRLRPEALCFHVLGRTLPQMWQMSIRDLAEAFTAFDGSEISRPVRLVVEEIRSRLGYLDSVGLGYLSLGRQSRTLSGGEVERVNLTAALGASLANTLFVLDEPSIGLHARDNARLLEILRAVRDRGNTVVVVEHDPAIMSAADQLIDLGPGSGERGGEIVCAGTVDEVKASPQSLTGDYLSGRRRIERTAPPREISREHALRVRGAAANNLMSLDVDLPLNVLCVVTGVSGSGKSSLLSDVVWKAWQHRAGQSDSGPAPVGAIEGFDLVDEVMLVDQSPLGKTPRGNPATYTKIFQRIRSLFAATPDAAALDLGAGHFSFNVDGGRCPECSGAGVTQVEMQFLSDVTLTCEECGGKRFKERVLEVRWNGLNISEVLDLTLQEAAEFFAGELDLQEKLGLLDSLGLGYLRLGQPINTLSGGEAQRLKLASRVLARRGERILFLLDEPTTGLHLEDVRKLLEVLHGLVERGHSVVVIEHHLDVIALADWLIDLGPEGGDRGGRLVAAGSPEEIAAAADRTGSRTGEWLRRAGLLGGSGGNKTAHAGEATSRQPRPRPKNGASSLTPATTDDLCIRVLGARENNLKNLNVDIPLNQFVVVTGLSGSGKSSLLYDIVFAEGQRRFLDCLSPYARQFVEDLHRPDIDHLEGIPPTVAIEQRTTVGGRKSTVGTVTEIYQFLRLLYSRVGVQFCPHCEVEVIPRRREEIDAAVRSLATGGGRLLSPAVRGKKGFHSKLLSDARRRGVLDARIDGEWVAIPEQTELRLSRHRAHDIDFVVERFAPGHVDARVLRESVARALDFGSGVIRFLGDDGLETVFNLERSCPQCGCSFEPPEPRHFSFLSRHGQCDECDGYGAQLEIDPERVVSVWDARLSDPRGPLAFLSDSPFPKSRARSERVRIVGCLQRLERGKKIKSGTVDLPLASWPRSAVRVLFEGDSGGVFEGLATLVTERLERLDPDDAYEYYERWGRDIICETCRGGRLKSEWLGVRVGDRSIAELAHMTVENLIRFCRRVRFSGTHEQVGRPIIEEIVSRLEFLQRVGLPYLTLSREASTLSTGEAQRIRLAAQLGSKLRGACYILDEPTIGLHASDNERLLSTLQDLRDRGNSVLVIEHDDATIETADYIIDMGPGPGRHGGEVVAAGPLESLIESERSATATYWRSRSQRAVEPNLGLSRTTPEVVKIVDAQVHNLKSVTASFPLGALTVVSGVSGAGKSTLVREVLLASVRRALHGRRSPAVNCASMRGGELLTATREVDQLPIGRTPRSTPATYVGVWDRVRTIFAATAQAKALGYEKRRFSFNLAGGRCETCGGQGRIRMEMNFLPDVAVDCEVCGGRRFNAETLEVKYRGKSIADVLEMTVDEALDFFEAYADVSRILQSLQDLGLGYLALGQASTTLSGGEAQRVKLAVELSKTASGACLYLLDEPTTGLHMLDVERLVGILRRLAEAGHAVVVIEHHLELIAGADWVLDLGPEGGDGGGELLFEGPPAKLVDQWRTSRTAKCLRAWLEHRRREVDDRGLDRDASREHSWKGS